MLTTDQPRQIHRSPNSRFLAAIVSITLSVAFPLNSVAATSSKAPPTPENFRVTAMTAYTVTVAWNAAPANSGDFKYHLSGAYRVTPAILPSTATSHTFTALAPGNQYWFYIYAKNSAGKVSAQQMTTTRTLLDTTPPSTAPVVSADEIGSNYVKLSWTRAEDDGIDHQFYEVWQDGRLLFKTAKNATSATIRFLSPATNYTFQIFAYDYGSNRSPGSNLLAVTTRPNNPADISPPTVPANVWAESFGDTEMQVRWTQSTDNYDVQANIRYDVYVNGVREDILFGSGGPSTVYGKIGDNIIEVTATDTSGNTSAAGVFRLRI
jgi:chitodextrinase